MQSCTKQSWHLSEINSAQTHFGDCVYMHICDPLSKNRPLGILCPKPRLFTPAGSGSIADTFIFWIGLTIPKSHSSKCDQYAIIYNVSNMCKSWLCTTFILLHEMKPFSKYAYYPLKLQSRSLMCSLTMSAGVCNLIVFSALNFELAYIT